MDTAPRRETAAVSLMVGRERLLMACHLNVKDRETNYGTLAYGQECAASSNDGPYQLLPAQVTSISYQVPKKCLQHGSAAGSGRLPAFSPLLSSWASRVGDWRCIQLSSKMRGSQGFELQQEPPKSTPPDLSTDVGSQ